jgi:hypothetical protein
MMLRLDLPLTTDVFETAGLAIVTATASAIPILFLFIGCSFLPPPAARKRVRTCPMVTGSDVWRPRQIARASFLRLLFRQIAERDGREDDPLALTARAAARRGRVLWGAVVYSAQHLVRCRHRASFQTPY